MKDVFLCEKLSQKVEFSAFLAVDLLKYNLFCERITLSEVSFKTPVFSLEALMYGLHFDLRLSTFAISYTAFWVARTSRPISRGLFRRL